MLRDNYNPHIFQGVRDEIYKIYYKYHLMLGLCLWGLCEYFNWSTFKNTKINKIYIIPKKSCYIIHNHLYKILLKKVIGRYLIVYDYIF